MTAHVVRHVIVRGRVQGVGFRAFVAHEARKLQLGGWVRNRRDGSVEAVFAGAAERVETMIEACRSGPMLSHVHTVEDRLASAAELDERGGQDFAVLATK
jgi:acylphosphatase